MAAPVSATGSNVGFLSVDLNSDTSRVIQSPSDNLAIMLVGIFWVSSAYTIGMIWTVMALIDRWRGPHGEGKINFISVLVAFVMASLWPGVLIILALN